MSNPRASHPEEAAFLAAIAAELEDDTARLVYAIPPLFEAMWSEWKASRREDDQGRWLIWDHREDAEDAMAEAVVKVIREAQTT